MKTFRRLCFIILLVMAVLTIVLNAFLINNKDNASGIYRVEAKRLTDEINETGAYDLSNYPHITGVFSAQDGDLYVSEEYYLIIEAGGELYRVEYAPNTKKSEIIMVNCIIGVIWIMLIVLMLYMKRQVH